MILPPSSFWHTLPRTYLYHYRSSIFAQLPSLSSLTYLVDFCRSFFTPRDQPSAMSSTERSALEATIVDACTRHEEAHWNEFGFRTCVSIGTEYFVKFGDPKTLGPVAATQEYIFAYAQSHTETPYTPRIPKVIFHFGDQQTIYIVMEYITLADPPPDIPERTADALKWLSEVPAPPGHVFGPLGGGVIRHRFFKDWKAPMVFSSIEALERYIEKVSSCLFLEHPLTC